MKGSVMEFEKIEPAFYWGRIADYVTHKRFDYDGNPQYITLTPKATGFEVNGAYVLSAEEADRYLHE